MKCQRNGQKNSPALRRMEVGRGCRGGGRPRTGLRRRQASAALPGPGLRRRRGPSASLGQRRSRGQGGGRRPLGRCGGLGRWRWGSPARRAGAVAVGRGGAARRGGAIGERACVEEWRPRRGKVERRRSGTAVGSRWRTRGG